MSSKRNSQHNRILSLTMLAIVIIAIFISWFNYRQQIDIFKEKELFKLDCIADAVSFKLDGGEIERLQREFPNEEDIPALMQDSVYNFYRGLLRMTVDMKELSSQMYTLTYDSTAMHFIFGVNSDSDPLWGKAWKSFPDEAIEKYTTGGILDMYEDSNGTWLSAIKPLRNFEGQTVAALQVDESFDIYQKRAREAVLMNILLSLGIILVVGALMYVSVRSILSRQQKLATERLEVENLRKELLANLSHDLRTPLASIQGYLETVLMKGEDLDPERRNSFLTTSLQSTNKLRKMVDELFELSKLEAKETQLELEPLSLADLIHDVVIAQRMTAQKSEIEVNVDIHQDLPMVLGDTKLVDRVLTNLIGNAVKYCEANDKVSVSTKTDNGKVRVTIQDNGPGIAEEDLPHIFDRFRRGKTEKSGTGLGLAIVKNILELHHSDYTIKSKSGQGTTFTFTLEKFKTDTSPVA